MFELLLLSLICLVSAVSIKNVQQKQEQIVNVVPTQNAVAQPEDGFCSICEAIVGFVESYVEQNATIAQIQARLDAACALTGPYASECKALVDQYLPQIIAWIEKNETPADICAQLGVCNNKVVKAPEDGFCSICEAIVGFVESYVEQNATIAQIQARLDAACALTGPYASECKALVDQYLPQIIAWIEKNETPADICTQLGVCNDGKKLVVAKPAAVSSGGLGCTICKTIVGYVEIYVQQNATEAEIAKALKKICAIVKPVEQICDNLVDNELPQLIAAVEKKESPAKACDQLKLCVNGTLAQQQKAIVPAVVAAVAKPEDGFCSICEAIVGFVESYVEQNATIAQIQARLDAACALTGPYASECKALVDQYLPQIIAWIEKNETPADICTQLGVCNGKFIAKLNANPTTCFLCKNVVGYVELFLQNNATEAQIAAKISKLCAVVGPLQMVCNDLVSMELPQIINYLEMNETPGKVCDQINLCDNSTQLAVAPAVAKPEDGFCSICTAIVGFVEAYIEQNATIAQIEARLDAACALTGPYASQCQALVNAYLPQIVAWIEKNETPQDICTKIGVCNDELSAGAWAAFARALNLSSRKAKTLTSAELCGACEAIIAIGDHYLTQNITIAEAQAELDHLCRFVGPQYTSLCESIFDNYTADIAEWIAAKATPTSICDEFELCDLKKK